MISKQHRVICGKNLYTFDGVLDFSMREHLYSYVRNSVFRIGNEDADAVETNNHKYLHSMYNQTDVDALGILKAIEGTEIDSLLKGKQLTRVHVNMSNPMDTNWAHDHRDQTAMLIYINKHWKHEWAGETMFFNDDLSEVEFASVYKPGRIVLFDGEIAHSVRPQAASAPMYRFTLTLFFRNAENEPL